MLLILVSDPKDLLRWTRAWPSTALSGEGELIYSCQGSVLTLGLDHGTDHAAAVTPSPPLLRSATLHLVQVVMFTAADAVRRRKGVMNMVPRGDRYPDVEKRLRRPRNPEDWDDLGCETKPPVAHHLQSYR